MSRNRRGLWYYPLFQIPLMSLAACLVAAALFWGLGLGRPPIAVAIAVDLSSSTYGGQFNAPGTVMAQEVQAVKSYLRENNQLLRNPNQIQVFGFGGVVRSLSGSAFKTDGNQLETELNQALQNPDLPQLIVSNTTDISQAIQKTTEALSGVQNNCRELLLVTDGAGDVSPIAVAAAVSNRVRINAIIVGADAPALQAAAFATRGVYLSGISANNLETFFVNRFFTRFNNNLKWIIFWLGAAWIALMWTLIMPLDRWIFQGLMGLNIQLAGQLSLGNAFFWSILTPIVVWQLMKIFDLSFFSSC